jgi:Tfp pilus assembly protein PilF
VDGTGPVTVDFIPPDDASRHLVMPLEENEIVAMYMNNRAAEFLTQNRTDEAYWWARAAIGHNPRYLAAYNTLGVVYQRHGKPELAEKVYRRALERSPEDTIVMHNLIPVLSMLGKADESKVMAARLASIEPTPPFHYFQQGIRAMQAGNYVDAKNMFAREVRRSPYYHEFHFWLGVAHMRLGNARAANEEFTQAISTSTTAKSTELYSSKLAYLRSLSAEKSKLTN